MIVNAIKLISVVQKTVQNKNKVRSMILLHKFYARVPYARINNVTGPLVH